MTDRPSVAFLGVDVGGSHTEVVLASADGAVLARAEGPGAPMRAGGGDATAVIVAELTREAAAAAGVTLPVKRAVIGAAGAGRELERAELAGSLRSAGVTDVAQVMADGELALVAAFGESSGIVLNAGTGSVSYARDPDGGVHRAGGYGWQMSDEGGGYWLGRRALEVVGRVHDGRDRESALPAQMLTELGLKGFDDLLRWAARATPAQIASLAPYLLEAAAAGERLAQDVLRDAAAALAELVGTLERHFPGTNAVAVATTGTLLREESPLAAALRQELPRRMPRALLKTTPLDPAGVAAGLAARGG